MKVLTILGTRPEIIRLSRIMPLLNLNCEHKVLHTGQNYDKNLNDIFFQELELKSPDYVIDSKSNTVAEQISKILVGVDLYLDQFNPDKVLILGDTNSALAAIIAERKGYPVYHMEAGNRCFDNNVPEEKNRKIVDAISSFNLPYTPGSRENLLNMGLDKTKIFETGNPIYEVINHYYNSRRTSISKNKPTVTVTMHREENVDNENSLRIIVSALNCISRDFDVKFSCHPRTKKRLEKFGIECKFSILEPMGFFDFISLQLSSECIISDSGTVQEEACILRIPMITIRNATERPETIECGANLVSGVTSKERILDCFNAAMNIPRNWKLPTGYDVPDVSRRVVNFLLSKN